MNCIARDGLFNTGVKPLSFDGSSPSIKNISYCGQLKYFLYDRPRRHHWTMSRKMQMQRSIDCKILRDIVSRTSAAVPTLRAYVHNVYNTRWLIGYLYDMYKKLISNTVTYELKIYERITNAIDSWK